MGITPTLVGFTASSDFASSFTLNLLGQASAPYLLTTTDEKCTFSIETGTYILDRYGEPVEQMTCVPLPVTHPPPEGNAIVLAYDFGPDGTMFRPYPILTFNINPDELPGVDLSTLKIAMWYDNQWTFLETTVDLENNTASAEIRHFTNFALISPPYTPVTTTPAPTSTTTTETTTTEPAATTSTTTTTTTTKPAPTSTTTTQLQQKPAEIILSSLLLSPGEVEPNTMVTIEADIANNGDVTGTKTVELRINGELASTRVFTLPAHTKYRVNFTTIQESIGTYEIDVSGLKGTLSVKETPLPAAKPFNWGFVGIAVGVLLLVFIGSTAYSWRSNRSRL